MENDPRIVELLAEMAFKLDKLNGLPGDVQNLTKTVENLSTTVENLVTDVRDIKQSLARQETLFTRHLETTEARQNTDIIELKQRVTVLKRKVA